MQPAADADLFFSTPALKETILLFLSVTIQRRKDSLGEGQSSPGTLRRRRFCSLLFARCIERRRFPLRNNDLAAPEDPRVKREGSRPQQYDGR